jgi:rod shape-determining protein MreC
MLRLFQFIIRYQAFLFFIALEVLCSWLVVRNNRYQNAAFFNSSNRIAGRIHNFNENINGYFDLKQVNDHLVSENAQLLTELSKVQDQLIQFNLNSGLNGLDSGHYNYIPARVINNSTRRTTNYITIDKGRASDILPDMAVINHQGIVGKVKSASDNFATITSVLHPDVLTSALLKKSNTLCTVKWDGRNPRKAQVLYVPRHLEVAIGDSVVSSGFNAIYPTGVPIGIVSSVDIKAESTFYNIELDFSTTFDQLSFVFVVSNTMKAEKDSLEQSIR